jgi:hypothetical protein
MAQGRRPPTGEENLTGRIRRLEIIVAAVLGTTDSKAVAAALRRLHEFPSGRPEIESMIELVRESRLWYDKHRTEGTASRLAERYETLERAVFSRMTLEALGVDTAGQHAPRYLPIRIFVGSDDRDRFNAISDAVEGIAEDLGFDGKHLSTLEIGSWWSRWLAKSRDVLSQPEMVERLQKLERAAEVQMLLRPQADVDEKIVNAVAKLNESFKGVPSAAVQIGTVLFLKITDPVRGERVVARTLTQRELIALEQSDRILLSDALALEKILDDARDGTNELRG